ncbi:hypothetical protein DQ04_10781000 [Trypanosoma grayi]|uniref:hypothetical protein n=1 Tax=Trypanosoma grayi TaxID=71804 RepID=UPI0004F41A76|nr:hypothetical protein DQ04_10781000 [Trypanosoma grayi]KEG07133.1 hypothetical protein DQ04_10781000 [Trypanosoma grayi]
MHLVGAVAAAADPLCPCQLLFFVGEGWDSAAVSLEQRLLCLQFLLLSLRQCPLAGDRTARLAAHRLHHTVKLVIVASHVALAVAAAAPVALGCPFIQESMWWRWYLLPFIFTRALTYLPQQRHVRLVQA